MATEPTSVDVQPAGSCAAAARGQQTTRLNRKTRVIGDHRMSGISFRLAQNTIALSYVTVVT
jgi:hypothetical protein